MSHTPARVRVQPSIHSCAAPVLLPGLPDRPLAAWAGLLLTLALASACGCRHGPERLPFPELPPMPPEDQVALVRSRADAIRSASAVIQVAIDAGELSGSFDIVALFRRPARLHLSAYKGLLISSVAIFELTFTAGRYRLALHADDGDVDVSSGALTAFPSREPDMAGLFWVREAIFLPGELDPASPARIVASPTASETGLILSGRTRDGAEISCHLHRPTLAVLWTNVRPPGDPDGYTVEYHDYREVGGALLPYRVVVGRRDGTFTMEASVSDVEVNGKVEDEVFRLETAESGAPTLPRSESPGS